MSEENKALALRWFDEVWNQRRTATIDELFHPEGRATGFPDPESILTGPEAFKAVHASFCATFSDIHVTAEDVVSEGDRVAVRWIASMTHKGDGLGFAPTGIRVSLRGSTFLVCRQGRVVEGWNHLDFTKVRQQLQEAASARKP